MKQDDPIGIIELGNNNLKCLIFNNDENKAPEILSATITPSEGIYNLSLIHISETTRPY